MAGASFMASGLVPTTKKTLEEDCIDRVRRLREENAAGAPPCSCRDTDPTVPRHPDQALAFGYHRMIVAVCVVCAFTIRSASWGACSRRRHGVERPGSC